MPEPSRTTWLVFARRTIGSERSAMRNDITDSATIG